MRKGWVAAMAAACLVLGPVSGAYADEDPPPEEEYEPDPYGDENGNFFVCFRPDPRGRMDDTISSPFDPDPPPPCPEGWYLVLATDPQYF